MSAQQIAFRQILDNYSTLSGPLGALCLDINDLHSLKVAAAKYWIEHIAVANASPSCIRMITKLFKSTNKCQMWFIGDNTADITRNLSAEELPANLGDMGEFIRYLLCHEHVKVSAHPHFMPNNAPKYDFIKELLTENQLVLNEAAASMED